VWLSAAIKHKFTPNTYAGDYALLATNHTNFGVIPESLYEGEPSNWKKFLEDLVGGLGKTGIPALLQVLYCIL
jgi:hypothetical protein